MTGESNITETVQRVVMVVSLICFAIWLAADFYSGLWGNWSLNQFIITTFFYLIVLVIGAFAVVLASGFIGLIIGGLLELLTTITRYKTRA
ncbi:hypothetical protein Q7404_05220 [Glaesserella parasuis]|nr:hypothetical protein [Glaesserella parasuis]